MSLSLTRPGPTITHGVSVAEATKKVTNFHDHKMVQSHGIDARRDP